MKILYSKGYCLKCLTNKRFSLRSIKEKNDSDIINAGFKYFSEFDEGDDLIPHLVICTNYPIYYDYEKTYFKEIFMLKMREYGVRSAISTNLYLKREDLITKEEVKQKYRDAHEAELKKDKEALIWRSLNDDLEYFYASLQNPESKPKAEISSSFLTQKLTEEELRLVDEENQDYLNKFRCYSKRYRWNANGPLSRRFNDDIEKMKTSSDSESKFSYHYCNRWTSALHVTLKSVQEKMRKRAADEDLSHMELKKQRVNWYNRSQFTYKFVKKE